MKLIYIHLPVLLFALLVSAERTKEKIYVNIDGTSACFRRMNGTHQIGCQSDPKGNVGVVHYVSTASDLDWLITIGPHKPYAVLLKPADFNMGTVQRLQESGKVNGIMVIDVNVSATEYPAPDSFSPDKSCPNQGYGLYKDSADFASCSKLTWNPYGEGLMFQDLSIPIFILTNKTSIDFIIKNCYEKFNKADQSGSPRDYPLCAVQLKDRMDGAKDSETCIRRNNNQANLNPNRYCDPLGDFNVFATVKEINNTQERNNASVIIAATRLDSFSMFESHYPSADNQVTGIVALLAAAEAIGKVKDEIQSSQTAKDIMFTFFQGEAFDYIGSGRMVYEMERNNFPEKRGGTYLQQIGLQHISHFVELNQLAYRDDGKVWIHTDPITRPAVNAQVSEMVSDLVSMSGGLVAEADKSNPLPSASVQSFLKDNTNKQFPAIVLTDHKEGYTNKYYNSRFDVASAIKMDYAHVDRADWYDHVTQQATNLTQVASVVAKYLYTLATGEDAAHVTVEEMTVTHLLYCLLLSPKCDLFEQIVPADIANNLASEPYPFYVGVNSVSNNYTQLTNLLLMHYLGDKLPNTTSADECKRHDNNYVYRYAWMQGAKNSSSSKRDSPYCMKGTANYSLAESIAFQSDDYDYKSYKYSTWTESSWATDAMHIQLFLIPSKSFEGGTLAAGLILTIVTMAITYFINKKSDVIFHSNGTARYSSYDMSL